jgi:hypothetical protein
VAHKATVSLYLAEFKRIFSLFPLRYVIMGLKKIQIFKSKSSCSRVNPPLLAETNKNREHSRAEPIRAKQWLPTMTLRSFLLGRNKKPPFLNHNRRPSPSLPHPHPHPPHSKLTTSSQLPKWITCQPRWLLP